MSSNKPAELSAVIACAAQARAASDFSPLAPYLPPPGAELHPTQAAQFDAAHAEARRWHDELLRHARGVQRYLHWSYADLCDEALRIPHRLKALATVDGRSNFDPVRLVDVAERVFGIKVRGKGETAEARLHARVARVLDAAYWRRTLRRRVAQAVELLELKLKCVGRNGSAYCCVQAQHLRETQRRAQAQWLEETTLQAVIDGEQVELPMAAVAKTARLYAFIAAMDKHHHKCPRAPEHAVGVRQHRAGTEIHLRGLTGRKAQWHGGLGRVARVDRDDHAINRRIAAGVAVLTPQRGQNRGAGHLLLEP